MESVTSSGTFALALAEYEKDFVATRERTEDGRSLFYFRRTCPNYVDYDAPVKQRLKQYVCTVFGVFLGIYDLPADGCYTTCIAMGRPPNPSCEVDRLYSRQIAVMQNIMERDDTRLGGAVTTSWFDHTALNPELTPEAGVFFIIIRARNKASKQRVLSDLWVPDAVGRPIQAVVAMERRIGETCEIVERDYKMPAMQYTLMRRLWPVKGADYICDVGGELGCAGCRMPS